jgi:hypothetical protein
MIGYRYWRIAISYALASRQWTWTGATLLRLWRAVLQGYFSSNVTRLDRFQNMTWNMCPTVRLVVQLYSPRARPVEQILLIRGDVDTATPAEKLRYVP